jgi:hypothetical protein
MNKYLKNKKIVAVGAAILILVIVGILFLVTSSKNKPADFSNPSGDEFSSPVVGTITAKELGLVITVRPDNKAVKFKINNSSDIKRVDYEIIYTHVLEGQSVQEGITGEMNIGVDGINVTDYRPFGTCSSGKCRYDVDVSDVKIILKVEKKDGKVYSDQESVPLNSE